MQMTENKLMMLLLLNEDTAENHTVTGLAKNLMISKAAVSKNVDTFEEEGYIRRADNRILELTAFGKRAATQLQEEVKLCEAFLAGGTDEVNLAEIHRNAVSMIAHLSESVKEKLMQRIRRNRIFDSQAIQKEELEFSDLAKVWKAGEYPISFVIFKEEWSRSSYYSMSNNGFAHPAMLSVQGEKGVYQFRAVSMERRNVMGKLMQKGRVFRIAYEERETGDFVNAPKEGDLYRIPAADFAYQYYSGEQLLTGVCRLKFYAPLGEKMIHEKTAILMIVMKNI